MANFRNNSKALFFILCVMVIPVRAEGIFDSFVNWFHRQAQAAQKAADAMGESADKAAEKMAERAAQTAAKVQDHAQKAAAHTKKVMKEHMRNVKKNVVEPMAQEVKRSMKPMIKEGVEEVEKHAKPAIKRAVKEVVEEAEKQAQPMIHRAEKRIQKNIARTIRNYMIAGLGGIASFIVVRKAVTSISNNNPGTFGGWLHRQDASSSALVADVLIGAMMGMGSYALWESFQEPVEV